jgi:hypothetical protein
MRLCIICNSDISFLRSDALVCSRKCQKRMDHGWQKRDAEKSNTLTPDRFAYMGIEKVPDSAIEFLEARNARIRGER